MLFFLQVAVYAESLIPTVRKALIDPLPEVREAAARTFENLHANTGSRALDEILLFYDINIYYRNKVMTISCLLKGLNC
jgi:hypothetical protein